MSVWLFQTEAYLRKFQATVTAVEDNQVAVSRTAFYPGGGGQPSDRGVLKAEGHHRTVTNVENTDSLHDWG